MSENSSDFQAPDEATLIEIIYTIASNYCRLIFPLRQGKIDNGHAYARITLWDGRIITATPISCDLFLQQKLEAVRDHIIIDGNEIQSIIKANLKCMLDGIKAKFATYTDCRDSSDILIWELKSS